MLLWAQTAGGHWRMNWTFITEDLCSVLGLTHECMLLLLSLKYMYLGLALMFQCF